MTRMRRSSSYSSISGPQEPSLSHSRSSSAPRSPSRRPSSGAADTSRRNGTTDVLTSASSPPVPDATLHNTSGPLKSDTSSRSESSPVDLSPSEQGAPPRHDRAPASPTRAPSPPPSSSPSSPTRSEFPTKIGLAPAPLFLSIDSSQKKMRAVVVDAKCEVVYTEEIICDVEMPEYRTSYGVYRYNTQVTEPSEMRVRALDLLLEKIARECPDPDLLNKVRCVSGASQQFTLHYLSTTFPSLLAELAQRPQSRMSTVVSVAAGAFSLPIVATGQDRSTAEQCRAIELSFSDHPELAFQPRAKRGKAWWIEEQARDRGRAEITKRTGSRCWTGWSAAQLMKIRQNDDKVRRIGGANESDPTEKVPAELINGEAGDHRRSVWDRSSRLVLESCLLTSLFLGRLAPIDAADACFTNLIDMQAGDWDDEMLVVVMGDNHEDFDEGVETGGQKLRRLLGPISHEGTGELGKIASYFVERFDFSPGCMICPFTGDTPATFLAYTLDKHDALVCLGVGDADTAMALSDVWVPYSDYQMIVHPAQGPQEADEETNRYVAAVVGRNGAVGRSLGRDMYANGDWNVFARLVALSPLGGSIGLDDKKFSFWFAEPDDGAPHGFVRCWSGARVGEFDDRKINPRLLLESQFLSLRVRLAKLLAQSHANAAPVPPHDLLGFSPFSKEARPKRIIAVGGACANPAVISLLATVFGAPVYKLTDLTKEPNGPGSNPTSSGLGAAHKAAYAYARSNRDDHEPETRSFRHFLANVLEEKEQMRRKRETQEVQERQTGVESGEPDSDGRDIDGSSGSGRSDRTRRPHRNSSGDVYRDARLPARGMKGAPGGDHCQEVDAMRFNEDAAFRSLGAGPEDKRADAAGEHKGLRLVAEPDLDEHKYYSSMLKEFARLERAAALGYL